MVIILSDPSKNIWFQTELRSAMKFYACVWMLNTVLSGHPAISLYFSNCPIHSAWTAQEKKNLQEEQGQMSQWNFFFSGNEPVKLFSMTVAFSYRTQARQYSKNDDLSIPFHF